MLHCTIPACFWLLGNNRATRQSKHDPVFVGRQPRGKTKKGGKNVKYLWKLHEEITTRERRGTTDLIKHKRKAYDKLTVKHYINKEESRVKGKSFFYWFITCFIKIYVATCAATMFPLPNGWEQSTGESSHAAVQPSLGPLLWAWCHFSWLYPLASIFFNWLSNSLLTLHQQALLQRSASLFPFREFSRSKWSLTSFCWNKK